jgi:hypothetical protein
MLIRFIIIFIIIVWAASSIALADPWKFAVMADGRANSWDDNGFGVAAKTMGILVSDIKNQSVDFVIFPGDLVISNTSNPAIVNKQLDSWKSVMKPLFDAGINIYVIRGNHDLSKAAFINHFSLADNAASPDGGFTYSFTHKNAEFFGFDQYINRKSTFNDHLYALTSNRGQMMNSWVTAQINNTTSPLNFAFGHEMLFPSKYHPDCMANDPFSRDDLVAALGNHHGAYLCGHDHMYMRCTASDGQGHTVPELIVGTAGGGNYDYATINVSGYMGHDSFTVDKVLGNSIKPYFGYLLVTIYDNNTWTGDFRAFRYDTYARWELHADGPIQTMDAFGTIQEANGSQVVERHSFGDFNKQLEVTPTNTPYQVKRAGFGDTIKSLGEAVEKLMALI